MPFTNKIILIMIIIIAIFILGIGFYTLEYGSDREESASLPFSLDSIFGNENEEVEVETMEGPVGDSIVSSGNTELPLTYQNKQFGFEMGLPEGYTGSSFIEGVGVTALLQNPESGESFQIYIASFDEPGPITVERIKQDLPELVISGPQIALIAGGSKEALIFIGESEDFGETREVWFVHNGQLYQVIAPFAMDSSIGPIMESLRFN